MLLKPQVLDRMITLNYLKPRLSISSAHAFLLVYSAVDPESVHYVKQRFEEIREQRTDFQVKMAEYRFQPQYLAMFHQGLLFKKGVNLSGQIVQDGPKTKIFLLQASG